MMNHWRDSYAKSSTLAPSAVVSAVVHVLLIAAAVAGTADAGTRERPLPANSIVRFLAPPDREAGQAPQREMIRYVSIDVPTVGAVAIATGIPDKIEPDKPESGADQRDAPALPELHGEDSVYSRLDVDSAAERYEWSAAPLYPPAMLQQSISGFVRAEFVVAQNGYADTASLHIVESTNPDFTKAVLDALPFMRFKPAKYGGRAVSQLVLQEFRFEIQRADSVTKKPLPPP
jgi:TonB family protein